MKPNGVTIVRAKADRPTLQRILERIEDGCYTPDSIANCSECGHRMFTLDDDQILRYMKILVRLHKAEWRDQGRAPGAQGQATQICVPKETGWKT